MASTSDPPSASGTEPISAAAPLSDLPPSSSKRRWNPSTWRYAIEEVQPELGSRPRSSGSGAAFPSSMAPPASGKLRTHVAQDHVSVKDSEEPARRSAYGGRSDESRAWRGMEFSEYRARNAQSVKSQEWLSKKKFRAQHPYVSRQQHQKKDSAKWQKEEQDEEEMEDENWDDNDDDYGSGRADEDDGELRHHSEGNMKRKKREVSPSEIYFCDICRAKLAAESTKTSTPVESPLLSKDP
ncbi:hypothetical protein KP509_01G087600 [Ceratopteris richardii]|uniref:Uncharacterized protein n=1 Tax=Ceratopteris richardii TaxID=49495 RepID=A0A8T2VIE6_CERRI|nr:hypothetical protein KP509_01G087600 [Ceratopteris richardii]